jgi:hypothetical protein
MIVVGFTVPGPDGSFQVSIRATLPVGNGYVVKATAIKIGEANVYGTTLFNVSAGFIYGDVNDDGNVNLIDISILSRYVAGWPDYTVNEQAADVNNDGVINMIDISILTRHIGGWEGYEVLPYGPGRGNSVGQSASTSGAPSGTPAIDMINAAGEAGETASTPIGSENDQETTDMEVSATFDNDILEPKQI